MRYFFDVRNGDVTIDDEGVELSNEDEAFDQAKEALASISREAITKGPNLVAIEIRDGQRMLGTVTMVIDVRRQQ